MKNVIPHNFKIGQEDRNGANGHNSFVLWFTGLSGSGKSTIANAVEQALFEQGVKTYLLDGDNVRSGINNDLTFSPEDRKENIRRIAEVGKLFVDAGVVVLAAFVSPYKNDRLNIENTIGSHSFVEIYVKTSIEECERRDVKGLYKKARSGEIKDFTGISAPYEAPDNPAIEIDTEKETVEASTARILSLIQDKLQLNHE